MHDADDTTLMRALRDADPVDPRALGTPARARLEESWRDAMRSTAGGGADGWTRRPLQLVAAMIAFVIVLGGGIVLWGLATERGDDVDRIAPVSTPSERQAPAPLGHSEAPAGTSERADAGVVGGNFRVTVRYGSQPAAVYDVADGHVRARLGDPWRFAAPASWRGFSGAEPVVVDSWLLAGDQWYLHARAATAARSRWYRFDEPPPRYERDLATSAIPRFATGTAGFTRVQDPAAAGAGLTRWTADVDAADLAFLGRFAPTYYNVHYAPGDATVDVWVDGDRHVRRTAVVVPGRPDESIITTFAHAGAVAPIAVPDGTRVPVATRHEGMTIEACGDPSAAAALRVELDAALADDTDVAAYRLLPKPTPAQDRSDDTQVDPDDRLFLVAARFRDGVDAGRALDRAATGPPGNLTVGDPVSDSSASVCEVGSADWMELGG